MNQAPLTLNRNLWIAALAAIFFLLSAVSMLKFLAAAAFYSAWYGVPRMAAELANVNRRADMFFLISVALLLLAAGCVTYFVQIDAISEAISSAVIKLVARYFVALVLSVFATGILVLLLDRLGVGAVPGAFAK